ncbi:MAG TPA: sugar phosphate isomerase/epimerase [Vicinamibacteria bacterium]|nr:sugar phosphate isomerase/epimerase [Vicinamibacteria bacterium]
MKLTRREFVTSATALALSPRLAGARGGAGTLGIATTSIGIRRSQLRKGATEAGPVLDAEAFLDLCHDFGADGAQMDYGMLTSEDAGYLRRVREGLDRRGMFLEFIAGSRAVEDLDLLDRIGRTAQALGVTRLRVACLSGRRYEDFQDKKAWDEFAARWRAALPRTEPVLRRHRLAMGVENHKDWLTDELVDILRGIGSPHVGACVDFGNNLAFLEDPLDTVEKLAPHAVTTHVKDNVMVPSAAGFLLDDVAVGEGVLPLERMVAALRRHHPRIPLVLEVITRDALVVPYRDDRFWVTRDRRDEAAVARFESKFLKPAVPPAKISDLGDEAALAAENENLRRSVAYARKRLGA